jgi:hypothetical protein
MRNALLLTQTTTTKPVESEGRASRLLYIASLGDGGGGYVSESGGQGAVNQLR